jgi:hypothetical protein
MSNGTIQRELRSGHVRLTVWENQDSHNRKYLSVDVVRLYKDKTGKWQRTYSFKATDLLDLVAVCQRAHQLLNIEERWQGLSQKGELVARAKIVKKTN